MLTIFATPSREIPARAQAVVSNEPGGELSVPQEIGGADRAADVPFKAFIDDRRTLHIEGTEAEETIIVAVTDHPASIAIEYRTDGNREPQKASFRLDEFDRLMLNARGGSDFVNIIDARELLDTQKKILQLDGGTGSNVVVLTHLPFKLETAKQIMRLLELSRQIEDVAKRSSSATTAALANDAMKLIESVRVNIADVSRGMASDAEKQLVGPARALLERDGPRATALGDSIVAKSDGFAKQHDAFNSELAQKYGPGEGGFSPDADNDDPNPRGARQDADLPESDRAKEKEAADVRTRAEQLAQTGLKVGDDAKTTIEQTGLQIEKDASGIEQRATEFERKAEELSARADALVVQGETDMTGAAGRVLAVVGELRSMEKNFQDAGMALRDEIGRAAALTPKKQTPTTQAGATGCNTPIATTHTYSGNGFFFPISAPSASWSITGGGGSDFLFGGLAADDIHGGAGNDVICGLKGNDHIHGDDGVDLLFGEFFIDIPYLTGNDCIWGDNGVDLVVGDNFVGTTSGTAGGDDSLWGDAGIDIVIGDDVLPDIFSQTLPGGKDAMEGNRDVDLLFGCGSDDNIQGNDDMDFAEGNGGDDVIDGGDGRNFTLCSTTIDIGNLLLGGRGNDDVTGGAGIDLIFGNEGDDKLNGKDQIDIEWGGGGKDKMYGDAGGTICIVSGIPIRLGNLMLGGTEDDKMWAGGDLDVMLGQDGDDEIRGYDGSVQKPFAVDADVLLGGTGNDYLEGDDESALLLFSEDFIFGGSGDDDMRGGKFMDFIFGQSGADKMRGDSNGLLLITSIDLIFGGPNDDWMDGGNSLDLMFGEGGNDTMLGDDESPGLISPDLVVGGAGADTMNGGSSLDIMFGNDDDDHMLGDSNHLWEPFSADFMWGNSGADYMDGGNSMDFMFGGPDCDTMLGDNSTPVRLSPDFMFGQAGNDNMDGGNSTDFMWGGADNDRMVGDQQLGQPLSLDWMWGNEGADTMLGGQGLDLIWSGPGVDHIDGQLGPDMLFGGANSDIINGGDFIDLIWGNEGHDLIHGNDWPDFIWGGDGDDCLYGDDGQDLILGDSGNDCLHGGSHVDLLFGNDQDDLILGDSGVDFLFGGSGSDRLDGGSAYDFIFGGSGQDEGWRGPGGAVFFSISTKHNGSSGLDCTCDIEAATGKICVHKFNDLNGDGIRNNGEPGLPGWVFQVTPGCAAVTLTTDANGDACGDFFTGAYTVAEQVQNGWTPTTPTTQPAVVTGGTTTNLNFGNTKRGNGELCVYKFKDTNGNGVRNPGEPLLPNWSFTVTNSSGVSTTLATPQTGGSCASASLPAGNYTVVEQPQFYWSPTTLTTQTVIVTAGTTTTVYFGNRPLKANLGQLCISKFNDLNGDGVQNTGEPLLPNWSFTVTNSSGVVATLVTDSTGRICNNFSGGTTYTVVEAPQNGWTPTTPATQTVIVTSGTTTALTFGNTKANGPSPCVTPPPDMVAWWPLDDPTGDSVVDDIAGIPDNGLPKPGPAIGPSSPSSLPGVVASGLNFLPGTSPTGPSHYLEVPTSSEVSFGTGDFTIDAWIKLGQAGNIHPIVDKIDFNSGYAFFVQSGSLLLRIGPASGGLVAQVSTGAAITAGAWHHVAVTVRRNDPSNKPVITFYIDGVLSGSGPPPGPSMPGSISIDGTTPLWIGGNSRLASGGAVVGLGEIAIDELEFFKRELSQTEIQGIFNAKSGGKCKCLVATKETITCNSNGTFSYTVTLTNLSSTTVSGVAFSPISNVTITPSSVAIPPLAAGASTTVTVTISGPGAISGANVCFSVGLVGPGGVGCKVQHCITLPHCKPSCVTPPPGMVAWWPMDEANGASVMDDIAGFNNQGVPKPGGQVAISGLSSTAGKVNGALYFTGPYVEVPSQAELNFGSGDFSIDAWVKPVDCSHGGGGALSAIVDKFNGTTGFAFYLNQPNVGVANLYLNINGSTFSSGTIPTLGSSTWSHVAVTVAHPQIGPGVGVFYVNGFEVGTFTPPAASVTNTVPMWIGKTRIPGGICETTIDELELFNRVLTPTELLSIVNAGTAGKCGSATISGLKFNDVNGNGVRDPGEEGLENWTIKVTDSSGKTQTTTTNSSGNYSFTVAAPGTYTVSEDLQSGWEQKAPMSGTYTVTVTPGQAANDRNFGNQDSGVHKQDVKADSKVWEVNLTLNVQVPSDITFRNYCKEKQDFEVTAYDLPFLKLRDKTVKVPGASSQKLPVLFDTRGMRPGEYDGRVEFHCKKCRKSNCTQDTQTLPVHVRVGAAARSPGQ